MTDTVEGLKKTYEIQVKQFSSLINQLIKKDYNLKIFSKNIRWSPKLYLRKDLEKLYKINHKFKKEFANIIRSTNTQKFKPYVIIHGYKFILDN